MHKHTTMDIHVLSNIMKFADPKTAISMMKAGGKELFDVAHSFGMIRNVAYDRHCFEIGIQFLSKEHEVNCLAKIVSIFDVDQISTCFCDSCRETYTRDLRSFSDTSEPKQKCIMFIQPFKTYKDALQNNGCGVVIFTNKKSKFFVGLVQLAKMKHREQIRFITHVRVCIKPSDYDTMLKELRLIKNQNYSHIKVFTMTFSNKMPSMAIRSFQQTVFENEIIPQCEIDVIEMINVIVQLLLSFRNKNRIKNDAT